MAETVVKDGGTTISCDEALRIARTDAESVYRDLSIYRIAMSLEENDWLVDDERKDPQLQSGGPHYVIDARTGAILSKRYEQEPGQTGLLTMKDTKFLPCTQRHENRALAHFSAGNRCLRTRAQSVGRELSHGARLRELAAEPPW